MECLEGDCGRPVSCRGYCSTCYYRHRRRGDFADLPPLAEKPCAAPDCPKRANRHGGRYCKMHSNRLARWGSLDGSSPPTPEHYAVLARVLRTDECWEWDGHHNADGYGTFQGRAGSRRRLAHRIIYGYYYGEPDPKAHVDHICGNTGCVNPDHLRAVTPKQNSEHFVTEVRSTNSSGHRGVSYDKARRRWRARVESAGHSRASYHKTIEEAGEAARRMRIEMHTHNDLDRI